MLHFPVDMFGPRIQGPSDLVLYCWVMMAADTLKIELRDAARSVDLISSGFLKFGRLPKGRHITQRRKYTG